MKKFIYLFAFVFAIGTFQVNAATVDTMVAIECEKCGDKNKTCSAKAKNGETKACCAKKAEAKACAAKTEDEKAKCHGKEKAEAGDVKAE